MEACESEQSEELTIRKGIGTGVKARGRQFLV